MSDIDIRITGHAGRITLTRPQALNAMTYEMCLAIEAAIDGWATDAAVALVIIDAEGDRAFCSGGDIADLYAEGRNGNFAFGKKFWADEYRLNHKIHSYTKPFVSFLQGFTMGGGVGIGCHGSHRIVGETSQIAMPECGIGLVPDVGGSLLLARAQGFIGTYLGITCSRMNADDAILADFADHFVPLESWDALKLELERTGSTAAIDEAKDTAPEGKLYLQLPEVRRRFAGKTLKDIVASLGPHPDIGQSEFEASCLEKINRVSPLSAAYTVQMLNRLRAPGTNMTDALDLEYRFTSRATEHGDFLEGIRAAIIDKDRTPKWQYANGSVPQAALDAMFEPTPGLTL